MTPERWQQICDLFHAALDRDADQRPGFLNQACAGDAALLSELEAMLAAHQEAGAAGDPPVIEMPHEVPLLHSGTKLGAYRIEAFIGAGGMGEVYRAHDPRIGRDVAIKVLPGMSRSDAARLKRFEQEARASGALNHPNVVTLYDVGTSDGEQPYLVIELLDGETLRGRLARGAMPVSRACEVAAAIARGLTAAHAKGIVHRDLKPENVMITRDGRVKILDFGIAKLRTDRAAIADRTSGLFSGTHGRSAVGTAAYMAPEQIRGEETDERADIFALGAILYELVAGRRAFDRESTVETLAAIAGDDPPPLAAAAIVPPLLERIVQRCLDKDPERRFQSARDLAFAIEDVTLATSSAADLGHPASRRTAVPWRALAAAVLIVLVGSGAAVWRLRSAPVSAARTLVRFSLTPPAGMRFLGPPAISPDGTLVVYSAGEGPIEKERLFVRRLDQLTETALPGTEGANLPFFSPDGRSVGFWADNKLKRTMVDATTTPIVVCGAELFLGGAWADDDTIIFGSTNHGLQRVQASGGPPQPLTTADESRSEIDHHTPKFLPGGRAVLFTVHERGDRFRIDVVTPATGARRTLVATGFDPQYTAGHVVYAEGTTLFDVPFDLDRLEVSGPPVKLLENVLTARVEGTGNFALSTNGTLVFRTKPILPRRTLAWADRTGVTTPLPLEARTYWTPRLSPDGRQFVVVVDEPDRRNLWVYRFADALFTQVTFDGFNWAPVWTDDGSCLAYFSDRMGLRHLMWQPSDATAAAQSLLSSESDDLLPGVWSSSDHSLVYVDRPPTDESAVHVLSLKAKRPDDLGVPTRSSWPALSPDGRWLAFVVWGSGGLGRPDIYVRPFPGPGQHRLLVSGAGQPVWSRSGDTLYFRSRRGARPGDVPDEGVFELPFDRARGVTAGPERQLFRKHFPEDGPWWGVPGFDVAPDGRFLIVVADQSESFGGTMNVLLHVDDELRRQRR